MPSKIPKGEARGWIVPIGGAENKENDPHILERFVRVSGGNSANIVVIPTASRMHETGPRYERLFKDLGAAEVAVARYRTSSAASSSASGCRTPPCQCATASSKQRATRCSGHAQTMCWSCRCTRALRAPPS
jgi:cyanophycinase-like exopeptidase